MNRRGTINEKTVFIWITIVLMAALLAFAAIAVFSEPPQMIVAQYGHRPIHGGRPIYHPYKIGPYGGPNYYRSEWTHYLVPDTSYGYRTYRPKAHHYGLSPLHGSNPNPRSLYYAPPAPVRGPVEKPMGRLQSDPRRKHKLPDKEVQPKVPDRTQERSFLPRELRAKIPVIKSR